MSATPLGLDAWNSGSAEVNVSADRMRGHYFSNLLHLLALLASGLSCSWTLVGSGRFSSLGLNLGQI